MGEKGEPTEVIQQLRMMAQEQPPGVREKVMQVLQDYLTVREVVGGKEGEDQPPPATPPGGPPATS